MQRLMCTSCGAGLNWDGQSPVVTCQFCGARFQMQVNSAAANTDWRTAALRGGCVADRPILDGQDAGNVVYRCWLPEGWKYTIFNPDPARYGMTLLSPYTPGIHMVSPDGSAFISHITTNGYQDSYSTVGFSAMASGFLNMLGRQAVAPQAPQAGTFDRNTFTRYRPLIRAVDYCDEVADLTGLQIGRLIKDDDPDDFVNIRIQKLSAGSQQPMWHDWARCTYEATANGMPYAVVVETQITTNGFNVNRSLSPLHIWSTVFELVLACPAQQVNALMPELERVRRSIELGRDFYKMKESVSAYIEQAVRSAQSAHMSEVNTMAQIGAQNAAHFDRMAQITQSANNDINNTMRSMNANTAATSDRIARMQSETIRGVNTYGGFGGQQVEADIRYDHVYGYQPGSQPYTDAYLGVEGDWLDPGVDFVELPRL